MELTMWFKSLTQTGQVATLQPMQSNDLDDANVPGDLDDPTMDVERHPLLDSLHLQRDSHMKIVERKKSNQP